MKGMGPGTPWSPSPMAPRRQKRSACERETLRLRSASRHAGGVGPGRRRSPGWKVVEAPPPRRGDRLDNGAAKPDRAHLHQIAHPADRPESRFGEEATLLAVLH